MGSAKLTLRSSAKTTEPGRRTKEMLKMKDDPDELLKTNDLYENYSIADILLKIKDVIPQARARDSNQSYVFSPRPYQNQRPGVLMVVGRSGLFQAIAGPATRHAG